MKKIIVSELSEALAFYEEMHDWAKEAGYEVDDEMFEPLEVFEGDPDMLNMGGYRYYFVRVELGETIYVLTSEWTDPEETKILQRFFEENWLQSFSLKHVGWTEFDQMEKAIAWRDGSGYVYTIYEYVGD